MKKRILITTLALLILAISNPAAAKMKMGPEGAAYPGVTSDGDDGLNVQGAVSVGAAYANGNHFSMWENIKSQSNIALDQLSMNRYQIATQLTIPSPCLRLPSVNTRIDASPRSTGVCATE